MSDHHQNVLKCLSVVYLSVYVFFLFSYSFNLSVSDGNNTAPRPLIINIMNINDNKPIFLK